MTSRNGRRISDEKLGGRWDPTRDGIKPIDLNRLNPDTTGASTKFWAELRGAPNW